MPQEGRKARAKEEKAQVRIKAEKVVRKSEVTVDSDSERRDVDSRESQV